MHVVAGAAFPYVTAPARVAGFATYELILYAAIALGALAAIVVARRQAISVPEALGFAALCIAAGFCGAHALDVLLYQFDDARRDPSLWLELHKGLSLFGAIAGIAATTWLWSILAGRDLARLADTVVLGGVLALVVGRIGCALVHDHPGVPTSLPIGVDFPGTAAAWLGLPATGGTIRLHDVGLEELALVLPLAALLWGYRRRLRPGRTALLGALAYAPLRFALDSLRLPAMEPRIAALTAGQWGAVAMLAVAVIAAWRLRDPPEPEPKAA